MPSFIHSHRLYDQLLAAGLVNEPAESVRRVSIVLEVGGAVVIHIERYADKAIEETLPTLLKDASPEVVVS